MKAEWQKMAALRQASLRVAIVVRGYGERVECAACVLPPRRRGVSRGIAAYAFPARSPLSAPDSIYGMVPPYGRRAVPQGG